MKAVIPYLLVGFLSCFAHGSERPNVLFIAIDDLVPTLGAYGDTLAQSPEIDALAAQGITFLNHHVQFPVCGPSRAALTTSLMPEETGVIGFKAIRHPDILPDVVTLPEHFKNNGYETACSGKFHDNRTVGDTTQAFDADSDQYPNGNSVDDPASWSIPWAGGGSGFSPSGKPAVDYTDQPDSAYVDWKILDNGLGLIDALAAGDKPFFLAVGFKKPHLGFHAPKQYWDLYDSNSNGDYTDDMPLPGFRQDPIGASSYVGNMLDFNNELLNTYAPFKTTGMPSDAEARELIHGYYACVSFIDSLVGQLLDKLAATDDPLQAGKKMSETTIVVLWGDHGFHLGDHNRWAKHSNLERSSSAPLIIYDPRDPGAGATTESPVNSVDLYPTLCELASLPLPTQPLNNTGASGRPLRGRSIVRVLEDPSASVNGGAVTQMNYNGAYGYAYRDERFRLIEWVDGSGVVVARDLFDYQGDGEERISYAGDAVYEAIIHQMSVSLRAEPATQGMTRLQSSPAYPLPVDPTVPGLAINLESDDEVNLTWPSSTAVTHRLLSNGSLGSVWNEVEASLQVGSATIVPGSGAEFFLVELDDNTPPNFLVDPLIGDPATAASNYTATLATTATDPDLGQALSYSKADGPSWLSVASDGGLSGTPQVGDLGANYFRIQVSDTEGALANATFCIWVEPASAGGSPTTTSFAPVEDTYSSENNSTSNYGTRSFFEVRQELGASSNFGRVAYLKFDVSGISGTVQSATLYLTPDTSSGNTPSPEADDIAVYSVASNSWSETGLNWSNQPALTTPAVATLTNSGTDAEQSVDLTSLFSAGDGTYSIALDEQGNSVGRLYSREAGSAAVRPRLEIVWE